MKRSKLLIIIALALACASLFVACGPSAEEKTLIKGSPTKALTQYVEKTFEPEIEDQLRTVFTEAFTNGSVGVVFRNEDLFDLDVSANTNVADKKFVITTDVDAGDGNIDFALFVDGSEIVVTSNQVLDGAAYGINLKTLTEDFKNSPLFEEMKNQAENGDTIEAELTKLMNDLPKMLEQGEELAGKVEALNKKHLDLLINELDALATVTEKQKVTTNGVKVDAVVVKYEFNKDALISLMDIGFKYAEDYVNQIGPVVFDEAEVQTLKNGLSEMQSDESYKEDIPDDFQCVVKVALHHKTGSVMSVTVDFDFSENSVPVEDDFIYDEYEAEEEVWAGDVNGVSGTLVLDFGENPKESDKYTFALTNRDIDETVSAVLYRTDKKDIYSRRISFFNTDQEEVYAIEFAHKKLQNEYNFTLFYEGAEMFDLGGYLSYSDKEFKFVVDSLTVMGEDYFGDTQFEVEAKAGAEVPPTPEYTNIFSLTLEELEDIGFAVADILEPDLQPETGSDAIEHHQ